MDNNKMKYFPAKPWELKEKKDYRSSIEAQGILSRLGSSKTNKIAVNVMRAIIAVFGVSYAAEVFGEGFVEKLAATDYSGNIIPITNNNGDVTIKDPIFVSDGPWKGIMGVFDKDKYLATDDGNKKFSIRDNKTLQETDYVSTPGYYPEQPVVDLETGARAFVEQGATTRIHLIFPNNTEQIFDPNAKDVHALEFSNSKLYAAIQDKTDNKFYIKIFTLNGEKQYVEGAGNKIQLPAEIYEGMEIHNGKIAVSLINGIYIYNQNTFQLDYTIPDSAPYGLFEGRPNANTLFIYGAVSGLRSIELTPPYKITTIVPNTDLTKLLDNDWDYVPSTAAFSNDGNRLYFATKSYTGQDKPVHYIVTIYLNQDGSVQKMEKSILTKGSPAPTPIDLSMDVDTDKQGGANKPDGITNSPDNCPDIPNNAQIDKNNNGIGDACENPIEYAASQGYDNYQEVPETGHNVFYNGDVDVIDIGDKVIISPSAGQEVKIGIINNGESQSKPVFVNIPPKTDYVWASFEGFGDVEETEPVDFPEGETVEGSTEENGVVVAVSGTDIELTLKPTQITADEGIAEEDTNGKDVAEDAQIVEENKDVFEVSDEMSVPDEMSGEEMTTENAAEAVEAAEDTSEEITEIVEKPDVSEEALEEVIAPDTHQETYIKPDSQPEKDNGGGGCDMNNGMNKGAEALTLTGAALTAIALFRRKIAKVLKR